MGKIITVYGQHGSGKTTVAVNLAYMLAERYVVGIINTQYTYPSIQHFFGLNIPQEKSFHSIYLSPNRTRDLPQQFVQHSSRKNLFLLSVPDGTTYLTFADKNSMPDKETAIDMLLDAQEKFDYLIVDSDNDLDNVLSDFALVYADKVVYLIKPDIQGFAYSKAHSELLDDLKVSQNKRIYVANMDKNYLGLDKFEQLLSCKIDISLPYDGQIEVAANEGFPAMEIGTGKRAKGEFLKLYREVTENG